MTRNKKQMLTIFGVFLISISFLTLLSFSSISRPRRAPSKPNIHDWGSPTPEPDVTPFTSPSPLTCASPSPSPSASPTTSPTPTPDDDQGRGRGRGAAGFGEGGQQAIPEESPTETPEECGACQSGLSRSVKLKWDPNPERDIAYYNVYHGHASRDYHQIRNVGNTTTTEFHGLDEDKAHYFAVTAVNTSRLESPLSDEVSWRPPSLKSVICLRKYGMNFFRFTYRHKKGRVYTMQTSTNLKDWEDASYEIINKSQDSKNIDIEDITFETVYGDPSGTMRTFRIKESVD